MTPTPPQKRVIDSVLSIFETGRVPTAAAYSTCAILPDGAGISYGKHQATDRSGSLDLVVKRYIAIGGRFSTAFKAYEQTLATNASTRVPPKGPWGAEVTDLVALLKAAGADAAMQQAQDEVFAEAYFRPACVLAQQIGLSTALGLLVVYDTCIHSGPGGVATIRAMFPEAAPANGGNERAWVRAYIVARRRWLATHRMEILHATVYRMDALLGLVNAGAWDLATPLVVRGQTIA